MIVYFQFKEDKFIKYYHEREDYIKKNKIDIYCINKNNHNNNRCNNGCNNCFKSDYHIREFYKEMNEINERSVKLIYSDIAGIYDINIIFINKLKRKYY